VNFATIFILFASTDLYVLSLIHVAGVLTAAVVSTIAANG